MCYTLSTMKDLIVALTVFAKYSDSTHPTHCEHDTLMIADVTRVQMLEEDISTVESLGFRWNEDEEVWYSTRFGSA